MKQNAIFLYPRQLSQKIRNKSPVKSIRFPDVVGISRKNFLSTFPPSLSKIRGQPPSPPLKANGFKDKEKMDRLVRSSQKTLLTVSAVFPFDLFPDQISIEPMQINFSKKSFFFTYHMQSIPIRNVADVFLQTSLLFASLKIIDLSYNIENSIKVDYLPKYKACKARRIIQGLVIANKESIDLSQLPPNELAMKAEQLGDAREIDIID